MKSTLSITTSSSSSPRGSFCLGLLRLLWLDLLKNNPGFFNPLQLVHSEDIGIWIKAGSTPLLLEDKPPEFSIILL